MIYKVFIDTNILIYAFTDGEDYRYETAESFLVKEIDVSYVYISMQVINEFCATLIKNKMDFDSIKKYLYEIRNSTTILPVNIETTLKSLYLKAKYNFSWWDSMLVATALENDCTIYFSEDLQHNQIIEKRLKIINPFENR